MRGTVVLAMALILLQTQASADAPKMTLNVDWNHNTRTQLGDIELADGTGTGIKDVYLGYSNDTVVIFTQDGVWKGEFTLGNASQIGSIYSIASADINGDGRDELIFGLGGAREVRTYEPQEYEVDGVSLSLKDKVLYRVIRSHGSVYVTNGNGNILWRYLTLDSARAVSYLPRLEGGGYVLAGVGDTTIYTYNEKTDAPINGTYCYWDMVNASGRYGTKEECWDKACENKKKCSATWYCGCLDTNNECEPDGGLNNCAPGTQCHRPCTAKEEESSACVDHQMLCPGGIDEECGIEYEAYICDKSIPPEKMLWHMVDYKELNGSMVFLDAKGQYITKFDITTEDDKGKPVKGADNRIEDIITADLAGEGYTEAIASSDNGAFTVLNLSNMSKIYASWKGRIPYHLENKDTSETLWQYGPEVRKVASADINNDKLKEVVAGTSEGFVVAFDSKGTQLWVQRIEDAVTGINMADVEGDDFNEVIVAGRNGVIYVYDSQGNLKWNFRIAQPIYGIRVADLGNNGLTDFVLFTSGNVTRYEMDDGYLKRFRADGYYKTAFDSYMAADYTKASVYVDKAASLYKEIGIQEGVDKSKLLRVSIDKIFIVKKKEAADNLYNLGLKFYSMAEFDAAIKDVKDAQKIYAEIGNTDDVVKCDKMIASVQEEILLRRKAEADNDYNRAVSLVAFENYTAAVDLLQKAKGIFAEVGYLNETIPCNILLIKVADKNQLKAQQAYELGEYQKATDLANYASMVYAKAESMNASMRAAEFARKAAESIGTTPKRPIETSDYTPFLVVAVVILAVAIIFIRTRGKGGKKQAKSFPEMEAADEELQALEKEA
jgi:hypothetical protein